MSATRTFAHGTITIRTKLHDGCTVDLEWGDSDSPKKHAVYYVHQGDHAHTLTAVRATRGDFVVADERHGTGQTSVPNFYCPNCDNDGVARMFSLSQCPTCGAMSRRRTDV